MPDVEKVINGLEKLRSNSGCVAVHDCDCKTCSYERMNGCCGQIIEDALALLKAQELVEPSIGGDADGMHGNWWYTCGWCHDQIDRGDKYCRWCGKAVKWIV